TDASGDVADAHPLAADVVHLRRNVGGAGGFAAGMARALVRHDADWVWLMDDDTIPRPGALRELLRALEASPVRLSVLSSRAVWTDGRDHPMNTQRTRLGASAREKRDAAQAGGRPIRTASYVSALLNGQDVRRLGLPYADYFIWSDDVEHTGRLLRHGRGAPAGAASRGRLGLVGRRRGPRAPAPPRPRCAGGGVRGRASPRRLRQRPARAGSPLLLRRAEPAVGARAHRLVQSAGEARARG